MRQRKPARWSTVALCVLTTYSIAAAADSEETCSTCSECEAALSSGLYDVVVLDADIIDHSGSCIELNWGESDVTFDCARHLIDSDGLSIEPARAVSMMQGGGNTVKNCIISDFDAALYLVNASDTLLENNLLLSNKVGIDLSNGARNLISGNEIRWSEMGMKITNSDDNTISSNTVCDNSPYDIYHCCSTGNVGLENTCDITESWNDFETTGCTFSCTVFSCGFENGDLLDWSDVVY